MNVGRVAELCYRLESWIHVLLNVGTGGLALRLSCSESSPVLHAELLNIC